GVRRPPASIRRATTAATRPETCSGSLRSTAATRLRKIRSPPKRRPESGPRPQLMVKILWGSGPFLPHESGRKERLLRTLPVPALQPRLQVGDDLGAVGLVEHLVTAARVNLEGHVQAGVPVAVDQRGDARQLVVDRVLVADEDIDRQAPADLLQIGRIGRLLTHTAERGAGLRREADAAQRVGDVLVDLVG